MEKKLITKKKIQMIVAVAVVIAAVIFSAGCIGDSIDSIGDLFSDNDKTPVVTEDKNVLSFYVDGELYSQSYVTSDGNVTLPPSPQKNGYYFVNWYYDKGVWNKPFSNISTLSAVKTGNLAVHAYFKEDSIEDNPRGDFAGNTSEDELNVDENPTDKKISVHHYLDEYSVEPQLSLRNVYKDTEKNVLYVVYNLGSVKGIALHQLNTPKESNDESETLKITETSITSSSMKTNCENILTEITGYKVTDQNYAGVKGGISATAFGYTAGIESEISETTTKENKWETTETITSSLEEQISEVKLHSEEYTLKFKNLERGNYYRYVLKGDAEVTQTFVYDMDKKKITDVYYNLEDVHNVVVSLEYSTTRSFEYDPIKSLKLDSINTDYLYLGNGTESDPYQIYNEQDLILTHINPAKYYRLCSNVFADVNPWSNEYDSLHLDYSYYNLNMRDGSEKYPYLIGSIDDFKRIYDDLSSNYILVNDIDLSGYLIPEDKIFSGTLDGDGHTLRNMEITIPDTKFTSKKSFGLFSENAVGGKIKNINIVDSSIIAKKQLNGEMVYVGIVTGRNAGTIEQVTISGCSINCERTGSYAGFVCGSNIEKGLITHASVFGNGKSLIGNGNGGGIAGGNAGKITSCSVEGNGVNDVLLSHWQYALGTANHGGDGMGWGGIAGVALETSIIESVSVSNMYVYIYVSGLADPGYYGYIIGYNRGKVIDPTSVKNVNCDLGRGDFEWFLNPQIEGLGSCTDHYFKEASGKYGYNIGSTST